MKTIYLATVAVLLLAVEVHGKNEDAMTMSENTVRAYNGTCGTNLNWELSDKGTLTITGSGYMRNYTKGGSPWYSKRSSITNIVIDEGMINIGNYAFYNCGKLKNVKMPDSLELIGGNAFSYCSSMTNVKIGNGVKSIMNSAFQDCHSLLNVTFGKILPSIGTDVFYHSTNILSFQVEKNSAVLSSINGVLFTDNNTVLVLFPQGNELPTYTIPKHVKKIRSYAFSWCKVTNVIIPDSVTTIELGTFYDCNYLVNITLPDSITSVGKYAFYHCDNLTNVKLSNKLERIEERAFHNCPKVTNIVLPKPLKYVGDRALNTWSSYMESIEVEYGNKYFKSIDGVLFNFKITELIQYPSGRKNILNYTIPKSVNTIRKYAFAYSQLKHITIPSSVKELNEAVFINCENLTCVVIPEGVQSIGSQTFCNCTNLGNITIPESMEGIDDNAFVECPNLTSVFYQGSTSISSTALKSLKSLTDVCTAPGYTSDTFCGAKVTPSSETCQTYQSFFSLCGKGSCIEGIVVEMKWDNVAAWERQTNECVEYHCDRTTGSFVSWRNCNTSDELSRVCVNGKCIIENNAVNSGWLVVIDMNNLTWNEMNESEIKEILSNVSGINDMKIGTEVDDKGNILRIIIYVQDEPTANTIAETIRKHDYEIFRGAINVDVKSHNIFVSNGHYIKINIFMLLLMIITMMG